MSFNKALAKRIKARGLQKLRYYCQMCEKQCRDANGLKCHSETEGHLRKLALFSSNSTQFLTKFSAQFEKQFVDIMRRRATTTRVLANNIYQDHIADREHVHMTATKWDSLTSFVQYLGKKGIAEVEYVEGRGWFVRYLDRDPAKMARVEAVRQRETRALDAQQREERELRRRMEVAAATKGPTTMTEAMPLSRPCGEEKLSLSLGSAKPKGKKRAAPAASDVFGAAAASMPKKMRLENTKVTERERIMKEERERAERRKATQAAAATPKEIPWLAPSIVVKVLNKTVMDGALFKQKGVVQRTHDQGYTGEVRMLKSKAVINVDQSELETVLPKLGHRVMIVKGAHTGTMGNLCGLEQARFCVSVQLQDGEILKDLPYDAVSKVKSPVS